MSVVVMAEITSTLSNLFGGSDEEKKEDMKKSEESQDTQTVAGDDGDALKEKVNWKEKKRKSQQQMRQQHVHQMLHSFLTRSREIQLAVNHTHPVLQHVCVLVLYTAGILLEF